MRYLKIVKREKEIQALKYLSEIESPANHTISDVQFWPVEGGTVVSMALGGGWLTLMNHPTEHLWSVALQLFEAVAFMHEHNIAHMDLKPQNIMIPSQGGRLSVIDFSVSIRVRGPSVKYRGVVGTEDYMAPEVKKGLYKPMLADLWSCGRTLVEFCLRCNPSANRTKLLEIAEQLMDTDPEARPKMNTLLEWMAPLQRGEVDLPPPTLR